MWESSAPSYLRLPFSIWANQREKNCRDHAASRFSLKSAGLLQVATSQDTTCSAPQQSRGNRRVANVTKRILRIKRETNSRSTAEDHPGVFMDDSSPGTTLGLRFCPEESHSNDTAKSKPGLTSASRYKQVYPSLSYVSHRPFNRDPNKCLSSVRVSEKAQRDTLGTMLPKFIDPILVNCASVFTTARKGSVKCCKEDVFNKSFFLF